MGRVFDLCLRPDGVSARLWRRTVAPCHSKRQGAKVLATAPWVTRQGGCAAPDRPLACSEGTGSTASAGRVDGRSAGLRDRPIVGPRAASMLPCAFDLGVCAVWTDVLDCAPFRPASRRARGQTIRTPPGDARNARPVPMRRPAPPMTTRSHRRPTGPGRAGAIIPDDSAIAQEGTRRPMSRRRKPMTHAATPRPTRRPTRNPKSSRYEHGATTRRRIGRRGRSRRPGR